MFITSKIAARWKLQLSEAKFKIFYRAGIKIEIADDFYSL